MNEGKFDILLFDIRYSFEIMFIPLDSQEIGQSLASYGQFSDRSLETEALFEVAKIGMPFAETAYPHLMNFMHEETS